MHDFFSMGVVNDPLHGDEPTYKTEDFMLAHLARLAGVKTYVDTTIRVHHLGVTTLPGGRGRDAGTLEKSRDHRGEDLIHLA